MQRNASASSLFWCRSIPLSSNHPIARFAAPTSWSARRVGSESRYRRAQARTICRGRTGRSALKGRKITAKSPGTPSPEGRRDHFDHVDETQKNGVRVPARRICSAVSPSWRTWRLGGWFFLWGRVTDTDEDRIDAVLHAADHRAGVNQRRDRATSRSRLAMRPDEPALGRLLRCQLSGCWPLSGDGGRPR